MRVLYLSFLLFSALGKSYSASYDEAVAKFHALTKNRDHKIKEGSRPFLLGQGEKARTVLLLHGLSDSPGSMKELAEVYFKLGFNVLSPLLRDHGLLPEYRKKARRKIKLRHWREDVNQAFQIALEMSKDEKVALAGYSMGGALSVDLAHNHPTKVSSLVLITPMFRMMLSPLVPLTSVFKHIMYSTKKGVNETDHFYPDIALNQSSRAHKLTRKLKRVARKASDDLLKIPKMLFLTSADTTIRNRFVLKTAERINIPKENIIFYENSDPEKVVLHRDMPMLTINSNGAFNPHLEDLLDKTEVFLQSREGVQN